MFVNVKNYSKALRNNESGAALLTTLLVSTLLLMVGGALLLTTNLGTLLSVDSTAEVQAYYCAEAGINNALNVLRGNIAGDGTSATFRNATTNSTLSPWLTYNTTIDGTAVISLSSSPKMGYTVAVTDPDNTPIAEQPDRLLVRVTGYGPKGSVRKMEVMVSRFIFDYSPIATVLIRGNDNNTTTMAGFEIGNSNAKEYSGYDHADPSRSIPVFGTTHANDYNFAVDVVNDSKPNTVSGVEKVKQFTTSSLPSFLQSADSARDFLTSLQATATGMGRYYTSTPGDFGSTSNPQFTFVDGDCSLNDGAGLLVVTGKLTASGNVGFNGIILVLGDGRFQRNGGGNGDTYGSIIVAKFARTWPSSENGQAHPFLSATYDMNGGGNSTTGYDSDAVDKALSAAGVRNMGIREY